MKITAKNIVEMLLLCGAGILVGMGIFYYVDYVENGVVREWFERSYVRINEYSVNGEIVVYYKPCWQEIKRVLLGMACVLVSFWLLSLYVVAHWHAERKLLSARNMQAKFELGMKEKERELQEESKRKNERIAYLAHDLKTPLASVIGYLSLLDEVSDLPEEQKKRFVRIALDKALRLGSLINEFFEITRYNLQQIQLEKEATDISYMLVQITDEFYPILREHGNEICLETPESLIAVVDAQKLARVFGNILKNAVAYSHENTRIVIVARKEEGNLRVSFENTGKTIPKERLNIIFEKFYRIEEERSSNTGGAGLGLAIAKEIVSMHKGVLEVQSENEKTIFYVTVPLS